MEHQIISIQFEAEVKCVGPECKSWSHVTHVILVRDTELSRRLYCHYSCSSCIYQIITSAVGPVENVLSVKKKGVGILYWVVFKKEWLSQSRWCEYDHEKLVWDSPTPWEDEPEVALVTRFLADLSTRERICTYIDNCRLESTSIESITVHKTPPQTHALKLDYKVKDDFTDFTIKVEDREFFVHRVIMAQRSEFFNGLLTNNMKEKTEAIVQLVEVSAEIFGIYMDMVYHQEVNVTMECVDGLLALADRIRDSTLTETCARFLSEQPHSLEVYELAMRYHLEGLAWIIMASLTPFRSPNDNLKGRPFDALPKSFERYDDMTKEMLASILREKTFEMIRMATHVSQYAKECSSILDDRLNKWHGGDACTPIEITVPLVQVQEIKALLLLIASNTCITDDALKKMGDIIGPVSVINSRAINCGPCSETSCKKTILGQRDHWRLDPESEIDLPGNYLCGRCFKTKDLSMQNPKRKRDQMEDQDADSDEGGIGGGKVERDG